MSTALIERPEVPDFMPAMTLEQADRRYNALTAFVKSKMVEGLDYGVIPGSDKPTLLKPGAEKLCSFFGLEIEDPEILTETEDWTGQDHGGEPFFYYKIRQRLTRGGRKMGSCIASCNSWEAKYRYRKAERTCPNCGKAAIIKGKAEFGGGWLCWDKKGGCKAKFFAGDVAIEGQTVGRLVNPDVADQVNTLQKMAQKRALIGATLLAVNASQFFSQDLDELTVEGEVIDKPPLTAEQRREILGQLGQLRYHPNHVTNALRKHWGKHRIDDLDSEEAAALIDLLNEKLQERTEPLPAPNGNEGDAFEGPDQAAATPGKEG